jgi:methylated-DNA-[protein]-cysteine S-methyltransferase
MRRLVGRYFAGAQLVEAPQPTPAAARVRAYFDGDLAAFDEAGLVFGGTDFQRAVWTALRAIPAATTTTYGALAREIGRPAAVRAVGAANGANPMVIAVPCHRVIGSDGSLTGYGGGLDRKRFLLAHEAAASGTDLRPSRVSARARYVSAGA